jgi:5-methylcytosine-specific restriction endonuclease McrBC regulatory subunit McrC
VLVSQYKSTLDIEGTVKIAPDLVWLVDGEVRACIDVKYKVEKHGQYPNADLYQMTAYCRRFGLAEAWLVYAAGDVADLNIASPDELTLHCRPLHIEESLAAATSALQDDLVSS